MITVVNNNEIMVNGIQVKVKESTIDKLHLIVELGNKMNEMIKGTVIGVAMTDGKIVNKKRIAFPCEIITKSTRYFVASNGEEFTLNLSRTLGLKERKRMEIEDKILSPLSTRKIKQLSERKRLISERIVTKVSFAKRTNSFVNLTPHEIVVDNCGELTKFPASGFVARVKTKTENQPNLCGFSVKSKNLCEVENILLEKGEVGIVSAMVLSAMKEQSHPLLSQVVAPNTDEAIRNEKGHIIAVPGFIV